MTKLHIIMEINRVFVLILILVCYLRFDFQSPKFSRNYGRVLFARVQLKIKWLLFWWLLIILSKFPLYSEIESKL